MLNYLPLESFTEDDFVAAFHAGLWPDKVEGGEGALSEASRSWAPFMAQRMGGSQADALRGLHLWEREEDEESESSVFDLAGEEEVGERKTRRSSFPMQTEGKLCPHCGKPRKK